MNRRFTSSRSGIGWRRAVFALKRLTTIYAFGRLGRFVETRHSALRLSRRIKLGRRLDGLTVYDVGSGFGIGIGIGIGVVCAFLDVFCVVTMMGDDGC